MKKLMYFAMLTVISCALLLAGCGNKSAGNSSEDSSTGTAEAAVKVTMLNVGQGDAILVETGSQTVLIDTSDVDERKKLESELKKANVSKIDKLILSHPHADHIGGVDVVLKNYPVGEIYDNGMISTNKLFINYVKAAKEHNIPRKGLKAGDVLDLGNGVTFKVLYPTAELVETATKADKEAAETKKKGYKHDPNNESVVGILNYKSFNMFFTGDAEGPVEKKLLSTDKDVLSAQALKSPHHGSKTGSTMNFLKAMNPKDVLISCGEGNSYGHPNDEALQNYSEMKMNVYRTDLNGTIVLTTDGKKYIIKGEK